jgi:hypothetical protein
VSPSCGARGADISAQFLRPSLNEKKLIQEMVRLKWLGDAENDLRGLKMIRWREIEIIEKEGNLF